jgi:hypothetical protein
LKSLALDAKGEIDGVNPHAERITTMAIATAIAARTLLLVFFFSHPSVLSPPEKQGRIVKKRYPRLPVSLPLYCQKCQSISRNFIK